MPPRRHAPELPAVADATRTEFAEEAKKEYEKRMGVKAAELDWEARLQQGAAEQALEQQRDKEKKSSKKHKHSKSKHEVRIAKRLSFVARRLSLPATGDTCPRSAEAQTQAQEEPARQQVLLEW